MRQNLDRIAPFLPWLGILLLLAGVIAYFITRAFDTFTVPFLVAGVIAFLLFVIIRPDDVRRIAGERQVRYGTITTLSIVLFTILGILLYVIAYQRDNWRLDLTATNEFTPLDETINLLESFDEPIDVIGFYTQTSASRRTTAEERLSSLAAYKSNLHYEFVDPNADPILAQSYNVTADSTLVFIRNKGQEDEITSQASTTTDRDLQTALVQLINPTKKTAYFLTGHGELDSTSFDSEGAGEVASLIEDQGFTNQELNLAVEGAVPDDADVVVLLGARAPMQPEEVTALADYLSNGGTAFIARDVLLENGQIVAEEDDLRSMLLDEWGVRLRPDYILETQMGLSGQQIPVAFFVIDFGTSPIISSDMPDLGVLFNIARSIDYQPTAGITYVELAKTTEGSWGESNFADPPQYGQEDALGPLTVALSAENSDTGGRIVVVGDVDFLNNDTSSAAANSLFFSNAMNWLAGDQAALELTPRETIERSVDLPQNQLGLIQAISCLTGPALVALIGIAVWFSRRRTV
ncbi:MAG: GldG family protein [Candidatus Promineifilaceae bacterium]